MSIESINPTTEEVLARFDEFTAAQTAEAVTQVAGAFREWRASGLAERGGPLRRAAGYLREHKERFARLVTLEMGKPITQATAEIEKCAWNCDFYADNAERLLADRPVATNARESYVAFEPLGIVLAVMPWNFPFWQVFRFAAPALMAGNTVLLKHASNVPQCALAIEEVFQESGFPRGVFRTLLVPGRAVEPLIADPRVRAVTLTGSDETGMQVAAAAGHYLKRTVLELGGSDPFVVLEDADLDLAARAGAVARWQNTGQSCIAAKRFIVVEDVAAEFERRFVDAAAALKVGDPLAAETQVGPMARPDLRDGIERQVRESVALGAQIVLGGERLGGTGYFFAPTILTNASPNMPILAEEVFGPVAAVVRARDVDHAVALANETEFGLGASIWTQDVERAKTLARRIEAGSVFVNALVASDPRLPFGGVKRSGYGRELGEFGILEFTNIQTTVISDGGGISVTALGSGK